MEQKYQAGKIYKLVSNQTHLFYVGSTVDSLIRRKYSHDGASKLRDKQSKLYQTMREIGEKKFRIELIELYPCETRQELLVREFEVIRQLGPQLNMIGHGIDIERRRARCLARNIEEKACECGISSTKGHINRHRKSQIHTKLMQALGNR